MGAVDIWSVDLGGAAINRHSSCLSYDETAFSDRLRGQERRGKWIRSRAALRTILGAHSGQHPAEVRFEQGPFGKPRLRARGGEAAPLHFNLTRSGDLCLIATCRGRPVGIDVELTRSRGGEDLIAKQFFAPRETAAIEALTGAEKNRAFLDIWTRKEAYTKAIGVGLQYPIRDLDLSAADADQPVMCLTGNSGLSAWRLFSLTLAAGYVGTVAVQEINAARRGAIQIRSFKFDWQFIPELHFHERA